MTSLGNDLENATIAAVSTSLGPGGISIIRISGPEAEEVLDKLFRPNKTRSPLQTHKLYLGQIIDPRTKQTVDQVLCCTMHAPATYTREDMVEIHSHGGVYVAARILDLVLQCGVSLAQPGEFTRRAFMAGRIDLTEAEAVAELIASRSLNEARLAAAQLTGGIKDRVEGLRNHLIEVLAHLEVALDFPDEETEILAGSDAAQRLRSSVLEVLEDLVEAYDSGRVFREGIKAAIVGRPNVGKSSLLNALTKAERAIVTPLPGTTRDVIEADAMISGLPVTLVDTAGLEAPAADQVEAEGQRRAAEKLAQADVILLVIDRSRPLGVEDRRIFQMCQKDRTIPVLNKCDLAPVFNGEKVMELLGPANHVEISALTGKGLDDLKHEVYRIVVNPQGGRESEPQNVPELVPNLRQKNALVSARDPLVKAIEGLESGLAPELLALEIKSTLDHLGVITGRTTPEDVLDEIFSSFCLGK